MDAPTGRSTSSQRSESQEDASGLLSSFDLTSLSNEHVMATVRRRRAATEQGNHPQARIYKKARMRTRNWSELRQRHGEQANPPPAAPNHQAEDINHPVVQPVEPVAQDLPAEANHSPAPPPLPTVELRGAPLPRDHLLLLVPPEPDLPNT
jgi:FtsZ-interacting cell division protein ZipA